VVWSSVERQRKKVQASFGADSAPFPGWRIRRAWSAAGDDGDSGGVFRYFKLSKILQDFSSHRIFEHMHETLNIDKKNN
jgi:hypothetical protein